MIVGTEVAGEPRLSVGVSRGVQIRRLCPITP